MSNEDKIIVPPPRVYFRLHGNSSSRVLFSRFSPNPTFGHSVVDNESDDQLWSLTPIETQYGQFWYIKNKSTGRVLSTWNSAANTNDDLNDSAAKSRFGYRGKGPNVFYINSEMAVRDRLMPWALFSRLGQQPEVGSSMIFEENIHEFSFLLEGMTIYRIEYHLDRWKLLSSTPSDIPSQTFTNNTDLNQIAEISFSTTRTSTYTLEHTHGFGITVGTKGKIGIPFVAEGEISMEGTTTHSWSFGSEISETSTFGIRFPVETRPGQTVTAIATISRSVMDVPWTIYTKHVDTGFEVETHGIFHGVQYYNVQAEYYLEPRNSPTQAMPIRVFKPEITRQRVDIKQDEEHLPVEAVETR